MSVEAQAATVLATWREAQRRLAKLPPDSIPAEMFQAEALRLWNEYEGLAEIHLQSGAEPLPAFPGDID